MSVAVVVTLVYKLVGVVDFSDGCNCKASEVRMNKKRLWLKIGNTAYSEVALKLLNVTLKLCSKR